MTFDKDYLARISTSANEKAQTWRAYDSTVVVDALATVIVAGYFNDKINDWAVGDIVDVQATDGYGLYKVTSVTTNVTVEPYDIPEGNLDLTYGSIFVGDASAKAVALDVSTDTQIIVGNGTTATSVALSGDVTMTNAGVVTIAASAINNSKVNASAAIAWSKMAALTDTNILVGNGSNVAVDVAMSGDATIANTGALTIANDAITTVKILASNVTEAKIAPNSLTGLVTANVADANVIGGMPILFRINTAGGATANTDVVMTHKVRIMDAWVLNNAAGTASDTIQILNSANAISDAVDISGGDTTIARVGTIDDAYHEIAAAGTLRVTETDGGGSDSPATTVYVLAVRVA